MKLKTKVMLSGSLVLAGYLMGTTSIVSTVSSPVVMYATGESPAEAVPMPAQEVSATPQFPRGTVDNEGICPNARTKEYYTGITVSRDEVIYWASKYWSGWDLEVAAAITVKEGQRDLNCIGDEWEYFQGRRMYGAPTADGRHWGESVGLYQYRTIIEQTDKGGCEDKNWQLGNIERQTECAYNNKWKQRGWKPWSQYTNGNYKAAIGK